MTAGSNARITVEGHADVAAQPDEVDLALEITFDARALEAALSEVAKRSEATERLLDELGIPRARWTTTGVSVNENTEWSDGKLLHKGYTASNRLRLRLAGPEVLGTLMNDAARRAQARISGPWWKIALDNPAHAEACRQAALDARRKAEAYAGALGARLGAIESISEPGIAPPRPIPPPAPRMMMAMRAAPEAAPEVTVQPGELTVSAAVIVTFVIEQG
jgi:uncharacterized protein YggE